MPDQKIAWWNCNIPEDQWTIECPPSLKYASEKDRGIIGSLDANFTPMPWDEVKHLVGE
jgi:hypothetical protein